MGDLSKSILGFKEDEEGGTKNLYFRKYEFTTTNMIINMAFVFYFMLLVLVLLILTYFLAKRKNKLIAFLKQKLYFGVVLRFIL